MLNFRWIRRKDTPNEVSVVLPNGQRAEWLNSDVQAEIIRTVAHAIVTEYGKEIIEDILGKQAFDEALKEAVVSRLIGTPRRDYGREWHS